MSKNKDLDKPLAPDLQVAQDLDFLRRKWAAERLGWIIFGLIILAGLVGLLGSGPLSSVTVSGDGGAQLEYERFVHRETPARLRIDPGDNISEQGTVDVAINQNYARNMDIQRIIPQPDSENMAGDELIFSFKLDEEEGSPSQIVFDLEYEHAGQWQGQVTVGDGSPMTIQQTIYP